MARLKDVIAAFLEDLTLAQHHANEVSKRLSKKYCDDTLLRFFPVPNALLDEAEVVLRFIVDEPILDSEKLLGVKEETCNVKPPPGIGANLEKAIAGLIIDGLKDQLLQTKSKNEGKSNNDEENSREIGKMVFAIESKAVGDSLSNNLHQTCRVIIDRLRKTPSNDIGVKNISDSLDQIKRSVIWSLESDKQLKNALGDIESAVSQAIESKKSEIEKAISRAGESLRQSDAGNNESLSIDVRLDAETLERFPEYTVQTLKLKAKMRNYKWVIVEDDASELLPEA